MYELIKSLQSTYKQAKQAHTRTIEGYKTQSTTLTQATKSSSFWSLKKAFNIFN